MKTFEKRAYIEKNYPILWENINNYLEWGEFRQVDDDMQLIDDVPVLQYIITWLCDFVIAKEENP
ncbi:MAG: hypothetical protein GY804_09880 [Alphaproteobacteria bacterium]|nr:hypothetical protein [Alphaproteobacteria bacterium]